MSDKSKRIIMMMAGGYLAYTGWNVVTTARQEHPQALILLLLIGIVFIVIGAVYLIYNLRAVMQYQNGTRSERSSETSGHSETLGSSEADERITNRVESSQDKEPSDDI